MSVSTKVNPALALDSPKSEHVRMKKFKHSSIAIGFGFIVCSLLIRLCVLLRTGLRFEEADQANESPNFYLTGVL